MGEAAINIFKFAVKAGAIVAVISGFVIMMTVTISGINVLMSGTVIMDLLTLVQMWSPFNIDPILLWLGTSVSLFIAYRLTLTGYAMLKSVMD